MKHLCMTQNPDPQQVRISYSLQHGIPFESVI